MMTVSIFSVACEESKELSKDSNVKVYDPIETPNVSIETVAEAKLFVMVTKAGEALLFLRLIDIPPHVLL